MLLFVPVKQNGRPIGTISFDMEDEWMQEGKVVSIDLPPKISEWIREFLATNPQRITISGGHTPATLVDFYEGVVASLHLAKREFKGLTFELPFDPELRDEENPDRVVVS